MFGELLSAAARVVLTPVTLVADVATLGGLVTDRQEPYTATNLKKAAQDLEAAIED